MTSEVWHRDPEEAYRNPYEYELQEQFAREAKSFLDLVHKELASSSLRYHKDDRTREKALWMLQLEAVDAARDCLGLLREKRHRLAGRLFRDIVELVDVAFFLSGTGQASEKALTSWYEDQIISHREARNHIEGVLGAEVVESRKALYRQFSKFTHRSYRALLKSYSLGRGDLLVYDGVRDHDLLILPQTIAAYYAILGQLIRFLSQHITALGLIPIETIDAAWKESMEPESFERRFAKY